MRTEIAAVAGLLVLTLAAPAAASPREYNRGYYDCSNGRYDEDAQSRAYREGCRDAQREQGGEQGGGGPGWGQNGGGWNGGGGPGWGQNGGGAPVVRPVGVPNVQGMNPGQVMAAMAGRGYRNVGTEVQGAAIYGFYFNPVTGECAQVANMNGRAVGAVPASSPRCR